jgi:hypothetical protein
MLLVALLAPAVPVAPQPHQQPDEQQREFKESSLPVSFLHPERQPHPRTPVHEIQAHPAAKVVHQQPQFVECIAYLSMFCSA